MSKKSLQIGIPVFIVLLILGVSALLFKFRYDKTVETRKMENSIRDAARAETVFPAEGVGMKEITVEDSPVEKSIALTILSPSNGTEVTSPTITVRGKTVPNADVFVSEKEGKAGSDGVFQIAYTLDEGVNLLLIVASDADGNATEEELTVTYDTGNQSAGAEINRATLTSKGTNSIGITLNDSASITVTIDGNTVLRRRYWGKSSLDEFQIGDTVSIYGKWTDDGKTTVTGRLIRDWSIQKRNGVFFGKVLSVTDKGWVMETKRGNQTVTSGGSITNRREDTIGKSDVLIGHRVRVKGLWDRNLDTITEVSGVKDYSLPLKTTATPGV